MTSHDFTTKIITILNNSNLMIDLEEGFSLLKGNELVAFPTETVYGLGANALSEKAVKKIFQAKGRPSDNPIIIHVSSIEMFDNLVAESFENPYLERLQKRFWPGPLTLIVPKSEMVPYATTGNLETIAVRMPSHPIALALIKGSAVPIAAPSANISGRPSPTTAQDVYDDLNGRIPIIIDGGPTEIGLESTVLDISNVSIKPIILRPGKITKDQIESCLGISINQISNNGDKNINEDFKPKSPGMKYRHYAPDANLILVSDIETFIIEILQSQKQKQRTGLILSKDINNQIKIRKINLEKSFIYVYDTNEDLASNLYMKLREMDKNEVDTIIVYFSKDYEQGLGLAIMNRLQKASSKK